MKKVTLLVSVLFIAFAAWADPVIKGTSVITLSCAGEPDAQVSFLISTSFSDAYDNTWDAEAANPGGIYVYSGGERYTTWASNGYTSGLKIGFASVAGKTSYTLKFSDFDSETYTFYDYETGESFLVNGSTKDYEFTAAAGTTFNDRFALNLSIPSGNLTTCFTGTELQITNNPIFGPIVVKRKSDGVKVKEYTYSASASITMNSSEGYSNGDYIVVFGSGTSGQRSFVVTVKN